MTTYDFYEITTAHGAVIHAAASLDDARVYAWNAYRAGSEAVRPLCVLMSGETRVGGQQPTEPTPEAELRWRRHECDRLYLKCDRLAEQLVQARAERDAAQARVQRLEAAASEVEHEMCDYLNEAHDNDAAVARFCCEEGLPQWIGTLRAALTPETTDGD